MKSRQHETRNKTNKEGPILQYPLYHCLPSQTPSQQLPRTLHCGEEVLQSVPVESDGLLKITSLVPLNGLLQHPRAWRKTPPSELLELGGVGVVGSTFYKSIGKAISKSLMSS